MSQLGFGVQLTFASGFAAEIINVDHDGIERGEVDTSHHGTTNNAMTFTPEALYDPGGLTIDVLFNPSTTIPITNVAENIVVTFPLKTSQTVKAHWDFSGFATKFKYGVPMKGLMTATMNIKASGPITQTAGS